MSLETKNQSVAALAAMSDHNERFTWLIRFGREHGDLPEHCKSDKYRIQGCTSQLWLVPAFKDGLVRFRTDSDAAIPKGLGALMAAVYSDLPPAEALRLDPNFLAEAGITEFLSMNRRNGLAGLHRQILLYCSAYAAMHAQGLSTAPSPLDTH